MIIHNNYINDPFEQKFVIFNIDNTDYTIPFYGYFIKIIDFGFSSIPERQINSKHKKNNFFNYSRVSNDILMLLHHIHMSITNTSVQHSIDAMLEKLDPKQRYIKLFPEYVNEHSTSVDKEYKSMLNNEIFQDYKTKTCDEKNILHKYKF
jgi:hypothetical protein